MDLSPRDATDLARFMARRFPERAQVDQLARKAGVELDDTLAGDLVAVWSTVVVEARIQGRLRPLARTLARSHRDDERLQEVCALLLALEDPAPVPRVAWLGGALVALALLAAGVGWALGSRGGAGSGEVAAAPASEVAAAPASEVAAAPATELAAASEPTGSSAFPTVPASAATAGEAAAAAPAGEADAAPPGEADAAPPGEAAATATAASVASVVPTASGAAAPTGCVGTPGQVVGYWYAGRAAPGAQGQTITLPQAVNVRADYPDVHNGYDARAAVRCTLPRGARQRLTQAPVAVPGGAWWVPLVGGDLVQ